MLPEALTASEVAGWLKLSADYVREIAAERADFDALVYEQFSATPDTVPEKEE